MTNIIITGGNGYIGKKLIDYLLLRPEKYFVFNFTRKKTLAEKYNYFEFDYSGNNIESLKEKLGKNPTMLINTAYDSKNIHNNKLLADFIVKLSNNIGLAKIIHLSTISIYDNYRTLAFGNNDKKPDPISLYGRVKTIIENYLKTNLEKSDLLILRLPIISGEGSSWDEYLKLCASADELGIPYYGERNSIFMPVESLIRHIESYIHASGKQNQVVNLHYGGRYVKWVDLLKEYNFQGSFLPTNNNPFCESKLKNALYQVISGKICVWFLFNFELINRLFFTRLFVIEKGKHNSESVRVRFSENTVRMIQRIDIQAPL